MGFVDRRKRGQQRDGLWGTFRGLAEHEGKVRWDDPLTVAVRERYKVKKWIGDIRTRLRTYFPTIFGDPFKPYRHVSAYETRFVLRWTDEYRRSRR